MEVLATVRAVQGGGANCPQNGPSASAPAGPALRAALPPGGW